MKVEVHSPDGLEAMAYGPAMEVLGSDSGTTVVVSQDGGARAFFDAGELPWLIEMFTQALSSVVVGGEDTP